MDGEKAKVATRLIRRINTTYLARILEVCSMKFSDLTPLEDRITAMLVIIRIEHGNHSEGKGGCTP